MRSRHNAGVQGQLETIALSSKYPFNGCWVRSQGSSLLAIISVSVIFSKTQRHKSQRCKRQSPGFKRAHKKDISRCCGSCEGLKMWNKSFLKTLKLESEVKERCWFFGRGWGRGSAENCKKTGIGNWPHCKLFHCQLQWFWEVRKAFKSPWQDVWGAYA